MAVEEKYIVPIKPIGKVAAVAELIWRGSLYDGAARIKAIGDDQRHARRVRRLTINRDELARLRFHSDGSRSTVRGWQGFEGTLAALRLALPGIGLELGKVQKRPPVSPRRAKEKERYVALGYVE